MKRKIVFFVGKFDLQVASKLPMRNKKIFDEKRKKVILPKNLDLQESKEKIYRFGEIFFADEPTFGTVFDEVSTRKSAVAFWLTVEFGMLKAVLYRKKTKDDGKIIKFKKKRITYAPDK